MSEDQKPTDQPARWKLSEAALLAAIPAYGYFLAFRYETGFATYYGYPDSLVVVSLEKVFAASLAMIIFLASLLIIANSISMMLSKENEDKVYYFTTLIISVVLALSHIMLRFPTITEFLMRNAGPILFCAFVYGHPLFSMKKHGGYFASLKAGEDASDESKRRSLIGRFSLRFSYQGFLALVMAIFFMPLIASDVGHRDAQQRSSYLVFERAREFVVLRIYGETMIYAPLNRNEKSFDRTFFLRPVVDKPKMAFSTERIGRLKPKE